MRAFGSRVLLRGRSARRRLGAGSARHYHAGAGPRPPPVRRCLTEDRTAKEKPCVYRYHDTGLRLSSRVPTGRIGGASAFTRGHQGGVGAVSRPDVVLDLVGSRQHRAPELLPSSSRAAPPSSGEPQPSSWGDRRPAARLRRATSGATARVDLIGPANGGRGTRGPERCDDLLRRCDPFRPSALPADAGTGAGASSRRIAWTRRRSPCLRRCLR